MKNCSHIHFQTLLWWPAVRAGLSPNVNIPPPRYCRQMNIPMQLPSLLTRAGYTQQQSCESEWCSLSHRVFLDVHISLTDIRNVRLLSLFTQTQRYHYLFLSFFLFSFFLTRTVENQSIYRKMRIVIEINRLLLIHIIVFFFVFSFSFSGVVVGGRGVRIVI